MSFRRGVLVRTNDENKRNHVSNQIINDVFDKSYIRISLS
jgi:hypothetical protein